MTWSFALIDGDLALDGADLAVVTGQSKLFQDLTCFLLTPLGSDDLHPDYGSTILGGIDGSGNVYQSVLAELNTPAVQTQVLNEIQRITVAYQGMQLARAKADQNSYGKTTLSKGEVLLSVNSITATPDGNTIVLGVNITTADGSSLNVNVPISG